MRAALSRSLANPAWLLLAGFALELVAVLFAVLPAHPPAPLGPLSAVLAGLVLATLGAVGLAREV